MAEDSTTALPPSEQREQKRYPVGVIAGILFLAVLIVVLLLFSGKPGTGQPSSSSSADSAGYSSNLSFSGLHLSAEENFLGQQVVYLDGTLTNKGGRTIRDVKVRLVFRDVMNQIVLREEHDVFGSPVSLGPGSAKSFQIRFDAVPDSWSRQVPEIQIVSLDAE